MSVLVCMFFVGSFNFLFKCFTIETRKQQFWCQEAYCCTRIDYCENLFIFDSELNFVQHCKEKINIADCNSITVVCPRLLTVGDYVVDITHRATLGSNRLNGSFPPNRGNITPLWLFYVAHYVWPYHETVRMSVCPSVCLSRVISRKRSQIEPYSYNGPLYRTRV